MKKIICVLLPFIILLSVFAVPTLAEDERAYVTDDVLVMSAESLERLNLKAADIFEKYGVGVYFQITETPDSDFSDYIDTCYDKISYSRDGIFFFFTNDGSWGLYFYGSAAEKFTDEDINIMVAAYNAEDNETYTDCVDDYLDAAASLLASYGYAPVETVRQLSRLTDNADVVPDNDETALLAKLDEISERQEFDVAIITVPYIEGDYTVTEYADDIYDYYGFGKGTMRDGCLLLLVMDTRDVYITTRGYGKTALTDAGIEYILDEVVAAGLSDGKYTEAFDRFATLCDEFIIQAKTGDSYDTHNIPHEINIGGTVGIAAVLGLLTAFIPVGSMKKKMKSVAESKEADRYVLKDTLAIGISRDTYAYSNVARSARSTSSDSSSKGGSSSHVSSSGASHGGGGRKF